MDQKIDRYIEIYGKDETNTYHYDQYIKFITWFQKEQLTEEEFDNYVRDLWRLVLDVKRKSILNIFI